MSSDIQQYIQKQITENPVVLYMKGEAMFPQCGFSQQAVGILKKHNIAFITVNVLANEDIRQGIKSFSNWPTIPQLYKQGEFIGGCDIMKALEESGELGELLANVTEEDASL